MIDPDGREWLTVHQAAARWHILPDTLRKWERRGKIRSHRTPDGLWLNATDIAHAERATRGKYARQRRQVS